jgi:hypothetical protein
VKGNESQPTPKVTLDPESRIAVHPALGDWLAETLGKLPLVEVDEEFVSWIVSSFARNGERRVRRYHFNRWNARRRAAMEKLGKTVKAQQRRIRQMEYQARRTESAYHRTSALARFGNWTAWGMFHFVILIIAFLALMAASATSAFVLLRISSEFAEFPAVCAAVGFIVTFGAVGVKFGLEQFKTETELRRMAFVLSGATLVLALTYCVLLAQVTGGFGQAMLDPQAIAEGTSTTDHTATCVRLMWVQMFYELTSSITLFSYSQQIYLRYVTRSPVANPESWMRKSAHDEAEAGLRLEQSKLEDAKAGVTTLRAERNEFVERAVALYLMRARTAQNQRAGIDAKAGKVSKEESQKAPFLARILEKFRN